MRNIKLTIEYDGKDFKGWQKQPNKPNIQGEIERAIYNITKEEVDLIGSGRTDAGVHALNQKAHFDLEMNITCDKLQKALNSFLSDYIYIKKVEEVSSDFHARFNVSAKEYI